MYNSVHCFVNGPEQYQIQNSHAVVPGAVPGGLRCRECIVARNCYTSRSLESGLQSYGAEYTIHLVRVGTG